MEVRYNVTGAKRKEMAKVISEALDGWTVEYLGAPSFAYRIGDFDISKDGTLIFSDRTDSEIVEAILEALEKAGFEFEKQEVDTLSVSLPRESFTDEAIKNLDSLLASKGNLIRKAFGIEDAGYALTDDRITFAWLKGEITPEGSKAFQDFITKLCEMAKTQKRVTAKPKEYDNEKYAFRCFLLRMGLIGTEYKESRKELLKNLSGNSAWRDGHKKEDA
ncbi:MAG: hypothetical protein IKR28_09975 [Selenomonadaceae bacterium]|nr:hypothetical protein [Selenomonadaceae bacterium]